MCAQGLASDRESYPSHTPSEAMSSSWLTSRRPYCPRAKRCSALAPVMEHCELAATRFPNCVQPVLQQQRCPTVVVSKGTTKPVRLRILSRLRDGYVKLMNEVASGADFAGVSSFYGAGHGTMHSGEYSAIARSGSNDTKSATSSRQSDWA